MIYTLSCRAGRSYAPAENHARRWSLIAGCERHGVDPQRYLTSVLAKIGSTPATELDQFPPDVWKREAAAEPMPNNNNNRPLPHFAERT